MGVHERRRKLNRTASVSVGKCEKGGLIFSPALPAGRVVSLLNTCPFFCLPILIETSSRFIIPSISLIKLWLDISYILSARRPSAMTAFFELVVYCLLLCCMLAWQRTNCKDIPNFITSQLFIPGIHFIKFTSI